MHASNGDEDGEYRMFQVPVFTVEEDKQSSCANLRYAGRGVVDLDGSTVTYKPSCRTYDHTLRHTVPVRMSAVNQAFGRARSFLSIEDVTIVSRVRYELI